MARKPTVNAEVRDNNDTKYVLTWHDFSLMRAYLATFDGIPLLSQETMAKRLGCTSTNTYSKWERGDQEPPSIVSRSMELLMYLSMYKAGEFVSEEACWQSFLNFKSITNRNSAMLHPRIGDVGSRLRTLMSCAYDCFAMNSGPASKHTVSAEGYHCQINGQRFIISPGFTKNGKLAGNTLELFSQVAAMVSREDYPNISSYENEGSHIAASVLERYREMGLHETKTVKTKYFEVKRSKDDMIVSFKAQLRTKMNEFLVDAAEHTRELDTTLMSVTELRDGLVNIIAKSPQGSVVDGVTKLGSHIFEITHAIGSNHRLKSRDFKIIEQTLCHLVGVDPSTIERPAPMLLRNAFGLSDADKRCIRTRYYSAAIEGRKMTITLDKPEYLVAINDFISDSMVDTNEKSVFAEYRILTGRASKLINGVDLEADPLQLTGSVVEVSDIISRRGVLRVNIANALERVLLGIGRVNITHSQIAGAVIKRLNSEHLVARASQTPKVQRFLAEKLELETSCTAQNMATAEIRTLVADLMKERGIKPSDIPTFVADCRFFTFEQIGSRGIITFKDPGSVETINTALVLCRDEEIKRGEGRATHVNDDDDE